MKTFPYTTPSGHTYQAPTDYKSLVNRVMDWQQSIIEQWDEDESPPDPLAFREFAVFAWNQAVRMTEENERQRSKAQHQDGIIREHMEECPLAIEYPEPAS